MNKRKFNSCLMQIRQGDFGAMNPIFDEYYGKFVITANKILHNYMASEDVASDMLEKIIQFAQSNERPWIEHPGAYLYSSVRNLATDVYRYNKRFDALDDISEDVAAVEPDRTNYAFVEQMFDSLGDPEYEIAVMHYFYGYKIREISLALGMPESTVKWRMTVIKKQISKYLKKI